MIPMTLSQWGENIAMWLIHAKGKIKKSPNFWGLISN